MRSFSEGPLTSVALSPTELFLAKPGQVCRTPLFSEKESVTIRTYARRNEKSLNEGVPHAHKSDREKIAPVNPTHQKR